MGRLWDLAWVSTLCTEHRIRATRHPLARSSFARPLLGTLHGWDLASPEFYHVPVEELLPRVEPANYGLLKGPEKDGLSVEQIQELIEAFPALFPEREETRFEFGAGWFPLALALIRELRMLATEHGACPQLKSAHRWAGTLRIEMTYGSEEFKAIALPRVAQAELHSARTCELCGELGQVFKDVGARCPAHREAYVQAELAACVAACEACGGFDVPADPLNAFTPPLDRVLWGWNLGAREFGRTRLERLRPLDLGGRPSSADVLAAKLMREKQERKADDE